MASMNEETVKRLQDEIEFLEGKIRTLSNLHKSHLQ